MLTLTVDLQAHVATASRIGDHCRTYALSCSVDSSFESSCDHEHDLHCERCDLFPSVLQEILAVLREKPQSEEIEELSYQVNQAVQDIEAWKAHLLRCINQDLARVDVLNKLTASSVLLVLDWAMKYLPRKFRESQADWYGKRGIPWHLTVAITKSCQGKIQMLTFAHMFKSATQESSAVLAVVDDVLKQLKTLAPQITKIYLRADNAGCYHAATTLLGLKQLATKHAINLVQFDFSDPQGGKGSCDRKAASLKNKMKVYLNSGHDIETPEQMKQGIESSGGIPGVRATCCSPQATSTLPGIKLKGISFLNNFKYTEQGIRVWKAYSIGEGQLIKWGELSLPPNNLLKEIKTKVSSTANPENSFLTVSASRRLQKKASQPTAAISCQPETQDHDSDTEGDVIEKEASHLFLCSEDGCVKSYQTYSGLQNHLDCGKHVYALEQETLLDKAMIQYGNRLEQGPTDHAPTIEAPSTQAAAVSKPTSVKKGWALKTSKSRKRLTEAQKDYLMAQFKIGEETGHKLDPVSVSRTMRKAKKADGARLFSSEEFLTSRQIASFFSRVSKKKVVPDELDTQEDAEIEQDAAGTLRERTLEEACSDVHATLSIKHPILYDVYNLCELTAQNEMGRFSKQMLKEMCSAFDLDPSQISDKRRKQPYIDLLTDLVHSCSCFETS